MLNVIDEPTRRPAFNFHDLQFLRAPEAIYKEDYACPRFFVGIDPNAGSLSSDFAISSFAVMRLGDVDYTVVGFHFFLSYFFIIIYGGAGNTRARVSSKHPCLRRGGANFHKIHLSGGIGRRQCPTCIYKRAGAFHGGWGTRKEALGILHHEALDARIMGHEQSDARPCFSHECALFHGPCCIPCFLFCVREQLNVGKEADVKMRLETRAQTKQIFGERNGTLAFRAILGMRRDMDTCEAGVACFFGSGIARQHPHINECILDARGGFACDQGWHGSPEQRIHGDSKAE